MAVQLTKKTLGVDGTWTCSQCGKSWFDSKANYRGLELTRCPHCKSPHWKWDVIEDEFSHNRWLCLECLSSWVCKAVPSRCKFCKSKNIEPIEVLELYNPLDREMAKHPERFDERGRRKPHA